MVAIFVLLTFIFFIVIDLLVLKAQKKTHPAFKPIFRVQDMSVFSKKSIPIPENILFSRGHTWAKRNEYGLFKIGIDEFIVKALGRISLSRIAEEETNIKRGDVIFEGAVDGKILRFLSPISGKVKYTNKGILGKKITNPYTDDWSVLMIAEDYMADKSALITSESASKWMKEEFRKLKDFLNKHALKPELAGVTMYDGGYVVEGVLSQFDEETLENFEKKFLTGK